MDKLATRIAIAILAAAAACTQPPGEDGGGNTDTFADRADGGADETSADDATGEDAEGDGDVPDVSCDPAECSAGCVADGWRVGTCTATGCECSDGPAWCGDASCGPDELCGSEGLGDGLDNDCDGAVDETCACEGDRKSVV